MTTTIINAAINYRGYWDPVTNFPILTDGVGEAGDFFIASEDGSRNLGHGELNFEEGDWVLLNRNLIWQAVPVIRGVVTSILIGTLDSQDPVPQGATAIGDEVTLQSASASYPGLVNTQDQVFTGSKTFANGLIGNLTGIASGNAIIEGITKFSMLAMSDGNIVTGVIPPTDVTQALFSNGNSNFPGFRNITMADTSLTYLETSQTLNGNKYEGANIHIDNSASGGSASADYTQNWVLNADSIVRPQVSISNKVSSICFTQDTSTWGTGSFSYGLRKQLINQLTASSYCMIDSFFTIGPKPGLQIYVTNDGPPGGNTALGVGMAVGVRPALIVNPSTFPSLTQTDYDFIVRNEVVAASGSISYPSGVVNYIKLQPDINGRSYIRYWGYNTNIPSGSLTLSSLPVSFTTLASMAVITSLVTASNAVFTGGSPVSTTAVFLGTSGGTNIKINWSVEGY